MENDDYEEYCRQEAGVTASGIEREHVREWDPEAADEMARQDWGL